MTFDIGGGVTVAISTYNQINATVSTTTSNVGTYTTDLSANGFTINDGAAGGAAAPVAITFASGDLTLAAKVAKINVAPGGRWFVRDRLGRQRRDQVVERHRRHDHGR